jgi:hypothetical protein
MTMQTDIRSSAVLTATGTVNDVNGSALGRVRIKGIYLVPGSTAGTITLRDGGASGNIVTVIPTVASATQPTYLLMPGQGLLCKTSVHATLTNVGLATLFYG